MGNKRISSVIGVELGELIAKHKPATYAGERNSNGEYERAVGDLGAPAVGGQEIDAWRFPDGTCIARRFHAEHAVFVRITGEQFDALRARMHELRVEHNVLSGDARFTEAALKLTRPWFSA